MNYNSLAYMLLGEYSTNFYLVSMAVYIFTIIANWKIFVKAGYDGWKSLIPFYNTWCSFEMVLGNGAKMFLLLIPIFNAFYVLYYIYKLGRAFGQETLFCIGLILFPNLFTLIIAFGKSEYIGPQ